MGITEKFEKIKELERNINGNRVLANIYRELAGSGTGIDFTRPRVTTTRTHNTMEKALCIAMDLEAEIEDLQEEIRKLKLEALQCIGKLEDSTYQEILIYRYFKSCSFKQIAYEIGYSLSRTYQIFNKAVEKADEIITD